MKSSNRWAVLAALAIASGVLCVVCAAYNYRATSNGLAIAALVLVVVTLVSARQPPVVH